MSPAKSKAQQRLFAAAAHGATFAKAKAIRASTTPAQRHDFAATKTAGLPRHVKKTGNRYDQLRRK